jgi:hypothetical protein
MRQNDDLRPFALSNQRADNTAHERRVVLQRGGRQRHPLLRGGQIHGDGCEALGAQEGEERVVGAMSGEGAWDYYDGGFGGGHGWMWFGS